MMVLLIVVHVTACFLLIGIVLIQQGRGGGLVESFSGVESMFGPKTSTFLTRATTVLSIIFFVTCLGLAIMSSRQSRSLMKDLKPSALPQASQAAVQPSQKMPQNAPQPQGDRQDQQKTPDAQGTPNQGAPKTE